MFKTNDLGAPLTPAQIDQNFWDLQQRAARLAAKPPIPTNGVVDVQYDLKELILHHANGDRSGPFAIPLPKAKWRGEFEANEEYEAFDVFGYVDGVYFVTRNFTAGTEPDLDKCRPVFGDLVPEHTFRPVSNVEETGLTLTQNEAGFYLRSLNGTVFTVPSDNVGAFIDGDNFILRQAGLGSVSVVPGEGVTLLKPSGRMAVSTRQHSVVYLRRVAVDTWEVTGDLRRAS